MAAVPDQIFQKVASPQKMKLCGGTSQLQCPAGGDGYGASATSKLVGNAALLQHLAGLSVSLLLARKERQPLKNVKQSTVHKTHQQSIEEEEGSPC